MRSIFKIFFAVLFISMPIRAELWRLDAGAGVWQSDADGTITQISIFPPLIDGTATDKLENHDNKKPGYFYLSLRHPIPVLPNIRFEYIDLKSSGRSVDVTATVTLVPLLSTGTTITGTSSDLVLKQYDTILFYSLLDSTLWMTLDLGLDMKYVVSRYTIEEIELDERAGTIVPMIYVRGRVVVPVVDIGLEADGKYITDGASTVYEIRAKIDYTLEFIPVVKPGLELG